MHASDAARHARTGDSAARRALRNALVLTAAYSGLELVGGLAHQQPGAA